MACGEHVHLFDTCYVVATIRRRAKACCSVLQCVAVCCSVLQSVAECCSVLQCVAVCCSVLQSAVQCVALGRRRVRRSSYT